MKKFSLRNSSYIFLPLILSMGVFLILTIGVLDSQAQETSPVSGETQQPPQETVQKERGNHESLQENIRLLRKEIDTLEEEMMDADSQKIQAQNDLAVSLGEIKLSDKEQDLYQARIKNLSSRLSRFEGDKIQLEKEIKFLDDDSRGVQNQIANFKTESTQIGHPAQENDQNSAQGAVEKSPSPSAYAQDLEKQLNVQQKISQRNSEENQQLKKTYADLLSELSALTEDLNRLRAGKNLSAPQAPENPKVAANSLREQIVELKEYRDQLKKSLNDLQKAALLVKSGSHKDFAEILKKLQRQNLLLKEKAALLETSGAMGVTPKTNKTSADLLACQKQVIAVKDQLQKKIAAAQKEYDLMRRQMPQASDDNQSVLKSKIQQSSARLRDLQNRINRLHQDVSVYQVHENLASQVEMLEKDLEALRDNPQGHSSLSGAKITSQQITDLKKTVDQLSSRRAILTDAVNAIHDKYRLDDISAKNLAAQQAQLKEYLATLSLENSALQQKLLTLQMRQDKKTSSVNPQ